jgi:DNA repair photolyase
MHDRFHPTEDFKNVHARKGVIEAVKNQLSSSKYIGKKILLCFMCDPYPDIIDTTPTREVMMAIKDGGADFSILTKGGLRATRDFDLYKPGDSFGATLTFMNDQDSLRWEPNAAFPKLRLTALQLAHKRGIKTWASMEPVIDPEQTLQLISESHNYIDLYKVGKINSDSCKSSPDYQELKRIDKETDWREFGIRAVLLLEKYGKEYYIKEDLKAYLG